MVLRGVRVVSISIESCQSAIDNRNGAVFWQRPFFVAFWVPNHPIQEMIDLTLLILLILFPVFTIIIGCRLVSYYLSDDFSKGFYWGKFVFVELYRWNPDW